VSSLPSGSLLAGFVGGMSVVMAGLGIGWVNAAADYSRYLPRSASSEGVVGWTTFGASLPLFVLIPLGVLLAAGNPGLASSANPIGDLARDLPTWFLVPYLLTAVGGLLAGAVLDIYSSGLNLLTLGVRIPRHISVAFDGVLMVLGNIYILFIAKNFITPFIGFLVTLGVLLAAWSAIFLVDFFLYRGDGYLERDLYDRDGRYGAFNTAGLVAFVAASVIGLGLVVSTASVFRWVGFLLWLPGMGGKQGGIAYSSIGLFIAFLVAGGLYALLSNVMTRAHRDATVTVR
jgi:purine-cytosine permease-like protein